MSGLNPAEPHLCQKCISLMGMKINRNRRIAGFRRYDIADYVSHWNILQSMV
jgi:hypothetical protein